MTAESLLKVSQIASNWGQPVSIVALVSICFWQARMMNGRLSNKVGRETCHEAMKGLETKVEILDEHQKERFEDLKSFIKNGG